MAEAARLYGPDDRPLQLVRKAAGYDGSGGTLSGDTTVSSVVADGNTARVPDLEVYWMLATKHPYVNACLTLIADAVASDGYDVTPAQDEDARPLSVKDDPRVKDIHTFFAIASDVVTDRARRWAIAIDIRAYGFSVLRKQRANKTVVGLDRLDPRTVSAKVNSDASKVTEYMVRRRNGAGLWDTTQVEHVDPKDIIFFASSGGDPLTGFASPLEALDLTLACDFAQRRYRQSYLENAAKLGLILSAESVDEDGFKTAAEQIRAAKTGASNAYKTAMLPGVWKVLNTATGGKDDGDFLKASGLNREDVAGVYKVPVGMLTYTGSALGSSGKGDDRDFFEEFAVLPLEELIYERLTLNLLRDEFGITDLALVPKRRNRIRYDRFTAAETLTHFGGTGNEARRLANLPPITDPKYDMDAPLFTKVTSPAGIVGVEPLNPSDNTGLQTQPNAEGNGELSTAADQTEQIHKDEVAQKGSGRFRGRRFSY